MMSSESTHNLTTTTTSSSSSSTSSSTSHEIQEALALKKALEWELSLDSRDLRSHAWYHGPLTRQRAEEIVQRDGDFLIRDCTSQPDNYVLTCRSKGSVLHFVINKVNIRFKKEEERQIFIVLYLIHSPSYWCNRKLFMNVSNINSRRMPSMPFQI